MLLLDAWVVGIKNPRVKLIGSNFESFAPEEIDSPVSARHPITSEHCAPDFFMLSYPMTIGRCKGVKKELEEKEEFRDINLRIIERNCHYYLFCQGSQQQLKKLPEQFVIGNVHNVPQKRRKSRLSTSLWVKRHLDFPFPVLDKTDRNELYVIKTLGLEEFMKLPALALDSEYMFWEKDLKIGHLNSSRQDMINFLLGFEQYKKKNIETLEHKELVDIVEKHFKSNLGNRSLGYYEKPMTLQLGELANGQQIVHYFEHLSSVDIDEVDYNGKKIITYKAENAVDLAKKSIEFLDEHPFIILISQNGMNYDLLQLREFVETEYKNAKKERKGKNKSVTALKQFEINGKKPLIKSSAGFFKKVVIPGIFHIDLAPYSQNYFPFTIDNKFETILSLILGRSVRKSQTYEDLTRMTIEQIIGGNASLNSAEQLRRYACEDVSMLLEAEQYIKPLVYLKARLFHRNPEDICTTSKRSLAFTEYEFQSEINKLMPVKLSKKENERYNELSSAEEFLGLLGAGTRKQLSKKAKGMSNAALYYIAPFTNIFSSVLNKNPEARAIFNYISNLGISPDETSTQKTLARLDLINTIEEGYLLPYILENGERIKTDQKTIKAVEKFTELVKRFKPLNHSENFYCFPAETARNSEFQKAVKNLGFKVSEGKLLSIAAGSFVLYDGVSLYKKGIDVKAVHGFRTLYQKELISNLMKKTFEESPKKALDDIVRFVFELKTGKLEKEKLIYFKDEIARDYFDYSSHAQRQQRVKAYIEFSMGKGERFAKVLLADGWHDIADFLKMSNDEVFSKDNVNFIMSEYFGPVQKGKRVLAKGKIGKYIKPLLESKDKEKEFLSAIESEGQMSLL